MNTPASMPEDCCRAGRRQRPEAFPHQGDEGWDQAEQGQRFAIALEAAHGIDEQDFLSPRRASAQFVEAGGEQRRDEEEAGNRYRQQMRPVERGQDDQVAGQRRNSRP